MENDATKTILPSKEALNEFLKAHKNIRKEEQLEAARMRTISALVSALKQVADLAGFEIVGRVVLMDKDSGRIFR